MFGNVGHKRGTGNRLGQDKKNKLPHMTYKRTFIKPTSTQFVSQKHSGSVLSTVNKTLPRGMTQPSGTALISIGRCPLYFCNHKKKQKDKYMSYQQT